MSRSIRRRISGLTVIATLVCSCVAPARTEEAYRGKGESSAATVLSAVQTADLTLLVAQDDGLFAPQTSILLAEAEQAAATAESTFASIQPPDDDLDTYRERLVGLLSRATDVLGRLRIAARRGDLGDVDAHRRVLMDLAASLERMAGSQA
jgi:hypothetical protein